MVNSGASFGGFKEDPPFGSAPVTVTSSLAHRAVTPADDTRQSQPHVETESGTPSGTATAAMLRHEPSSRERRSVESQRRDTRAYVRCLGPARVIGGCAGLHVHRARGLCAFAEPDPCISEWQSELAGLRLGDGRAVSQHRCLRKRTAESADQGTAPRPVHPEQ